PHTSPSSHLTTPTTTPSTPSTPFTTHFRSYVDVKATNTGGSSAFTSLGSIPTLANAPVSASPTNVQTSQITANWTANGNPAGTSILSEASSDPATVSISAISTTSLTTNFTG